MNDYIKNLKYDIPAAMIVFLVAVPLCLGIALASFPKGETILFSGITDPTIWKVGLIIAVVASLEILPSELFKAMFKQSKYSFIPFIITITGVVIIDLVVGITLGLMVAICFILYHNYKRPFLFDASKYDQDGQIHSVFAEDVTLIDKANIQRTLAEIPSGLQVILDTSTTMSMDHDAREIIKGLIEDSTYRDIEVEIIDLNFSCSKINTLTFPKY